MMALSLTASRATSPTANQTLSLSSSQHLRGVLVSLRGVTLPWAPPFYFGLPRLAYASLRYARLGQTRPGHTRLKHTHLKHIFLKPRYLGLITLLSVAILLLSACAPAQRSPTAPSPTGPSPTALAPDGKVSGYSASKKTDLPTLPLGLAPLTLRYGSGVPAESDDFLAKAGQADYILIGEQHTSAEHHKAQAAVIALLAQNGYSPAIGLEMIPASLQPRLNDFNARLISVEHLSEHLDWENVWGFTFADYKPIFSVAEHYNTPVYGLNVSQEVIKAIRKVGTPATIPPRQKSELPPVIQYPTKVQYKKLSSFFRQHASMLMGRPSNPVTTTNKPSKMATTPSTTLATVAKGKVMPLPKLQGIIQGSSQTKPHTNPQTKPQGKPKADHGSQALRRFVTIQSLWDSAMAYNATQTGHAGPLVILAGGAHVEYGYGIAHRLAHFAPKARCLTLMPLSHPQKIGTGEADFYYITNERQ